MTDPPGFWFWFLWAAGRSRKTIPEGQDLVGHLISGFGLGDFCDISVPVEPTSSKRVSTALTSLVDGLLSIGGCEGASNGLRMPGSSPLRPHPGVIEAGGDVPQA